MKRKRTQRPALIPHVETWAWWRDDQNDHINIWIGSRMVPQPLPPLGNAILMVDTQVISPLPPTPIATYAEALVEATLAAVDISRTATVPVRVFGNYEYRKEYRSGAEAEWTLIRDTRWS